jgi:hypothetical protein
VFKRFSMVMGTSVVLQLCLVVMVYCRGSLAGYIDITVPVSAGMPTFQSSLGLLKNWRSQHQRMDEGDVCNQSVFFLDGEVKDAYSSCAASTWQKLLDALAPSQLLEPNDLQHAVATAHRMAKMASVALGACRIVPCLPHPMTQHDSPQAVLLSGCCCAMQRTPAHMWTHLTTSLTRGQALSHWTWTSS